jgi:integrase
MTETQRENPSISLSGESWNYFIGKNGVTPDTKEVYIRYMTNLLTEWEMTPDQFYNWLKEKMESGDRREKQGIQNRLTGFYLSLLESELHINTIDLYVASVRFFCKSNALEIPEELTGFTTDRSIKQKYPDSFAKGGKDKATKEEIRELLNISGNPRTDSFILMTYETGLRASDIVNMKIRDISPVLENPDLEFYSWEMIPIKNMSQDTPLPANPTIGFDSIKALRKWIKYRTEILEIPISPDSPVYCAVTDKGNVKKGDQIAPNTLSRLLLYLRQKAGIENPVSMHSLRKSNSTYLMECGIPERWVNVFQGKKGYGTQGTYQKPDTLEVFKKAYNQFSIYGVKQSEKVQSLEERIEELESIVKDQNRVISQYESVRIEDTPEGTHLIYDGEISESERQAFLSKVEQQKLEEENKSLRAIILQLREKGIVE